MVAAALSRFSLAFSPTPFCESGLRAEEACDGWSKRPIREKGEESQRLLIKVDSASVGRGDKRRQQTYLVGEVLSSSVRHVCDCSSRCKGGLGEVVRRWLDVGKTIDRD